VSGHFLNHPMMQMMQGMFRCVCVVLCVYCVRKRARARAIFYVENTFYREHILYREHDASQVHVTCYATTPSDHSPLRRVAEETCHAFHLVASWSDDRVAQVPVF